MAKYKKTNAMRMLDRAKIDYHVNTFDVPDHHISGEAVAKLVNADVTEVYKTLVLENQEHDHFVFVIPVNENLDMKEAAHVVNEKKLHLMPLDDLKAVTGYVRGGCSPIGMKHLFPTVLDKSIEHKDKVNVSGGQRGMQIVIGVNDLIQITNATVANVIHK